MRHCTKLDDPKLTPELGDPPLAKEHGPGRVQLDEDRQDDEQPPQEHEQDRRTNDVEQALEP